MLQMAKINGLHLHYQYKNAHPGKPCLVFSNSLGTDFRIWTHCLAPFANEYNYLLYDKRGHGLSQNPAAHSSINQHAQDLLGLLDHLSIQTVIPIGLSVGGLIVQELYHLRPEIVHALILSNTATKVGKNQSWNERTEIIRRDGLTALADTVLERWFAPNFKTKYPDRYAAAETMLHRSDEEGYIATCMALRDADLTAKASNITVPTLCLAGSEDQATPPAVVEEMSKRIANSKFVLLPDVGHIPCLEDDVAFCAAVSSFLESTRGN